MIYLIKQHHRLKDIIPSFLSVTMSCMILDAIDIFVSFFATRNRTGIRFITLRIFIIHHTEKRNNLKVILKVMSSLTETQIVGNTAVILLALRFLVD